MRRLGDKAARGALEYAGVRVPCALGKAGITARKREGDLATPRGRFRLIEVRFDPRRTARPQTPLPVKAIAAADGWCDDPEDRNYNRPVRRPYPARTEPLARDDQLYTVVVVLDYNIRPRRRGAGSAIFMHVARPGLTPTEGCVALGLSDLKRLLRRARRGSQVVIA